MAKEQMAAPMEGYCVKCKEKRAFAEGAEEVKFGKKGDRKAMKGKCSKCGTGMYKILGKADMGMKKAA